MKKRGKGWALLDGEGNVYRIGLTKTQALILTFGELDFIDRLHDRFRIELAPVGWKWTQLDLG